MIIYITYLNYGKQGDMYNFFNTAFTWLLIGAMVGILIFIFLLVYKAFFYMVNEPSVKRRFDQGNYEAALQDLAEIPDSNGSSSDHAITQHLNQLCSRIHSENEYLTQRVAYLKSQVTKNIQTTGNLEDRLRVAQSDSGIEYEKSLLQQLARTYGLRFDHE